MMYKDSIEKCENFEMRLSFGKFFFFWYFMHWKYIQCSFSGKWVRSAFLIQYKTFHWYFRVKIKRTWYLTIFFLTEKILLLLANFTRKFVLLKGTYEIGYPTWTTFLSTPPRNFTEVSMKFFILRNYQFDVTTTKWITGLRYGLVEI